MFVPNHNFALNKYIAICKHVHSDQIHFITVFIIMSENVHNFNAKDAIEIVWRPFSGRSRWGGLQHSPDPL